MDESSTCQNCERLWARIEKLEKEKAKAESYKTTTWVLFTCLLITSTVSIITALLR